MMMSKPFNQPPPVLGNQYEQDRVLRSYLRRALPPEVLTQVEPSLQEMGRLSGGELYQMQLADRLNEPALVQWDAWGERVDKVVVSPLWQAAERLAAEHGLVAAAYEKSYGRFSRLYQFALAYLFHPSTDVYTCPLAMTDGAAQALLRSNNQALLERALPHLTSRDPQFFWTSGQWMTESTGGSDVGRSETVARQEPDGTWRLYGRKWFTSAAASQMALTLARPEGNAPGGQGLALFFVELRDENGCLRNIVINRLKDKLGTRKVPTAELVLEGAPAQLVKGTTGGIRNIVPMLHLTRTWNSVCAVATMRRGIALARDFARKRVAFGAALADKPLHVDTLATLQAEFEGAFHLSFLVAELIGKDEAGEINQQESALLRVLTSLAKLTTARQAVAVASEVLETFGGAGYVEDTGLPLLLRDSQVLPIWEGTTNVLSLDALDALSKGEGLAALQAKVTHCVKSAREAELVQAGQAAEAAIAHAVSWLGHAIQTSQVRAEAGARRFAMTLGRTLELALLVEHAQWSLDVERDNRPRAAARRLIRSGIDLIADMDAEEARALANDKGV